MPYHLEDYFGVTGEQLQAQTLASPEAPTPVAVAGEHPLGDTTGSTSASFTDWRRSPVFWVAVFAVIALGLIHLEGNVRAQLG